MIRAIWWKFLPSAKLVKKLNGDLPILDPPMFKSVRALRTEVKKSKKVRKVEWN